MSYILEFRLDGLPKRTNNQTSNWHARAAEAKKWKRAVWDEVWHARRFPASPLDHARITYTRASSNRPDHDGLVSSFKHVQDGLIEAKVIANDKYENIGEPIYLWEKVSPRSGFIKVRVEEI